MTIVIRLYTKIWLRSPRLIGSPLVPQEFAEKSSVKNRGKARSRDDAAEPARAAPEAPSLLPQHRRRMLARLPRHRRAPRPPRPQPHRRRLCARCSTVRRTRNARALGRNSPRRSPSPSCQCLVHNALMPRSGAVPGVGARGEHRRAPNRLQRRVHRVERRGRVVER